MALTEISSTPYGKDCASWSREIRAAIAYIEDNYASALSRERVATACYLSPNYFSTLFRMQVGLCFREYLIRFRMEKAAALLQTGMQINDVAAMVGYRNRNRFIINFREQIGCIPSEYRKSFVTDKEIET